MHSTTDVAPHLARKLKRLRPPVPVEVDPVESARAAGLVHVSDDGPGIRRHRRGKGFSYYDARGHVVKDKRTLGRIKSLAIPPAWTDVWICPDQSGHIQATGRDARGRKQYRYHPRWRTVRDETKYDKMIVFGLALPLLRERVDRALTLPGLPREKVLATVVRLLEMTLIRVGNEEYARENHSFGLTTLKNRHVDVKGCTLRFQFRGKSGRKASIDVTDKRLARIVQKCRDLPGQELFQYLGDDGELHPIGSADVNEYLREITGERFTAKDFRTWNGTVLALAALSACPPGRTSKDRKNNVVRAIAEVAGKLGNTTAVCRKCYVHPAVVESYLDGTLADRFRVERRVVQSLHELSPEERACLAFLRATLKEDEDTRAQAARLGWGEETTA